jgi:hypothetical protein
MEASHLGAGIEAATPNELPTAKARVCFLTDFRVARELTRESGGSVPLGDMSLPRIWLEGLDLIGAWS